MSNKRRSFGPEFKLHCVLDVLSGQKRPAQVCRERNISESLLTRWNVIQGSQYKAHNYCTRLRSLGTEISMSASGRAWENTYAESVIGHLKDEEVWMKEYIDFQNAFSKQKARTDDA